MPLDWEDRLGCILGDIIHKHKPTGCATCYNIAAGLVPCELTYTDFGHGCIPVLIYGFAALEPILVLDVKLDNFYGWV